jgi:ribonuclease R
VRDPQLEQDIVSLLRKRGNRLLPIADIHDRLANPEITREDVAHVVEELERDGVILPVRGKRYSLLEFTPYHAGRVKVHPDGYGTVFGGDDPDVYIDRKVMKGAMNGDLVVVRSDRHTPKYKRLPRPRLRRRRSDSHPQARAPHRRGTLSC